ncbi:retrovirus-related pol polyprotein from transposon TNT 1-94, partial [Tanacetum coccineum]
MINKVAYAVVCEDKAFFLGLSEGCEGGVTLLLRFDDESPKIVTSWNVVFNESVMFKDTLKDSGTCVDNISVGCGYSEKKRTRMTPLRFRDESNMAAYVFVVAEEEDIHEPLTYQAAVAYEDSSKWKAVMKEEMDSLRTKKYEELSATEKIQADCDCKATNIILQGLAVPVFNQGDEPIDCLNKAMAFLTAVASLRVTVKQFQRRQGQSYAGNSYKGNATSLGGNNTVGQARVVKCYNCQGKKAMLAEAQEDGQILDEEQLAFLADPRILDGQAIQTTILNTIAFQTEYLDAYDSDCDDVSNAKEVLMANLSSYSYDVLSEVPYSETSHNDMGNQSVYEMQSFEQTLIVDFSDNEITSDSNIIPVPFLLYSSMDQVVLIVLWYRTQDVFKTYDRKSLSAHKLFAFQKNTCFIRNLEGVDLLSGSRDTNLYTISLDDMLKTYPICLLSKASKTKSWLWHRRLSHLNFGTLNKLDGLARGIPKLKFQKDHLCSARALGKSKKSSHQPKAEDINQEKLYLVYMDLCGPMCVESINGKKTLHDFYENVGVSHQTSVARTPQQNGIVERRNQTLLEASRIMLIFSKALLRHDKKLDLSFLHVFGSLCYPTNDSEDLGKLNAKVDIGIFI